MRAADAEIAASHAPAGQEPLVAIRPDELQGMQFAALAHRDQQRVVVQARAVGLNALAHEVGMIARRGCRSVPDLRRFRGSFGLPRLALGIKLRLCLRHMPLEGFPFHRGKRLVALRLPVLGKSRRPVAEATSQTVVEQLAPARRVAVALADAGKACSLPGSITSGGSSPAARITSRNWQVASFIARPSHAVEQ